MGVKIGTKLIAAFIFFVLLMVVMALYSVNVSQKSLRESVGKCSIFLAQEMLKRMNHDVYLKIEKLRTNSSNLFLQNILTESNSEFEKLDSVEEYLSQKDREWVSAPKDERTPFMQELISQELSNSLRREFIEFYEKRYGYRVFGEAFVTNKYGANVAQTGKTSEYRQDDEHWWQIAKKEGFYVGDVEYDESTEMHVVNIGVRVDDEKGAFIGVIKGVLDFKRIIREAEILTRRFETTEIKLITEDGRLIYATEAFRFLEYVFEKEFFKKIKGESGFFIGEEGGIERLYSYVRSKGYRDFEGLGWILVVGHDVGEVLQSSFILRNSMVVASVVLIAISIVIGFIISRSITSPIKKLSKGAEIIGKGDLEHRVKLKTKDEIGELALAFNQMTERRQCAEEALRASEKSLRKSQEKYRILAGKLLSAQEEERRLLAREMHDDLTQRLAVLAIETGRLEQQVQSTPDQICDKLREMKEKLVELSEDVHAISRQLHPSILDDLGLVDAIKSECTSFNQREGIVVSYETKGVQPTIPKDVALCIYRIIQEGLRNIAKHAQTPEAHISLICKDDSIHLSIEDTGIGFDPTQAKKKTGLGLASMEERVRLIQGKIRVRTKLGEGTAINIWVPLSEGKS